MKEHIQAIFVKIGHIEFRGSFDTNNDLPALCAAAGGWAAGWQRVGGGLVTFTPHIMLEKLYLLKCVNVKHIGKAW